MTLRLNGSTSGYTEIDAPAIAGSNTLRLPTGNGTNGNVLATDGSGNLSWVDGRRMVLETAKIASGTSVDFFGIPSWVKRVSVNFVNISTGGTSAEIIRIGDSSGFSASGYEATTSFIIAGGAGGANGSSSLSGFTLLGVASSTPATQLSGRVVIDIVGVSGGLTYWACSGVISRIDAGTYFQKFIAGQKGLSGTLDRVQVTTITGASSFDNGLVNIIYEG